MIIFSFLLPIELEAIRKEWLSLFPDTCTVNNITKINDGYGGTSDTVVSTPNIRCMIGNNGNGIEARIADKLTISGQYILSLPVNTNINAADTVLCKGVTYYVHDILRDFSNDVAVVCVVSRNE